MPIPSPRVAVVPPLRHVSYPLRGSSALDERPAAADSAWAAAGGTAAAAAGATGAAAAASPLHGCGGAGGEQPTADRSVLIAHLYP